MAVTCHICAFHRYWTGVSAPHPVSFCPHEWIMLPGTEGGVWTWRLLFSNETIMSTQLSLSSVEDHLRWNILYFQCGRVKGPWLAAHIWREVKPKQAGAAMGECLFYFTNLIVMWWWCKHMMCFLCLHVLCLVPAFRQQQVTAPFLYAL